VAFRVARLSHRIMAGLLRVFPHVRVMQSKGGSYAWASQQPLELSLDRLNERIEAFLDETKTRSAFGEPELTLMTEEEGRERARGFEPIGEADMQVVLKVSVNKLIGRYYEPD
jgi:hypothetical protein